MVRHRRRHKTRRRRHAPEREALRRRVARGLFSVGSEGVGTIGAGYMTAGGDRRARFESEALVHLDVLYGLALRLTGGDQPRAEDLVQETALKAWRGWDRFAPGTNARAWLVTILRNTFINEFRRRRRAPDPVAFDEIADRSVFVDVAEEDPEGGFFDRLIDDEVVAAIDELPDEFRVAIVLSDLEGLSYEEVSEVMGIPVGTVKSRLYRARKRLQRRLYTYAKEMGYLR